MQLNYMQIQLNVLQIQIYFIQNMQLTFMKKLSYNYTAFKKYI